MNKQKQVTKQITGKKKILYTFLLVVVFPLLFILLIELALRLFGAGDNLNLFIDHPAKELSQYKIVNPSIGKKYFKKFEYTKPANDVFLKEKPENGYRIFVMGSSTVFGFPYGNNLMFPRILDKRLQDAFPDKEIEVINTAITAINTVTLNDLIEEIIDKEPDAILFYAGHNEFYGAFGIGSNERGGKRKKALAMHFKLMNLRIYQGLYNLGYKTGRAFAKVNSAKELRGTLMKKIVKKSDIVYQSPEYKMGIDQYRENLTAILTKANKANIPMFIGTLTSNTKDIKPFKSIKTEEFESAIDVYKEAQKAEREGAYTDAKQLYEKARDLDCIRFRASGELNEVIRELSAEYKFTKVPVLEEFEKASENQIIGNSLLTEHVHPNIPGYFLMADAFFKEIIHSKVIADEVNRLNHTPASYYPLNWGFTQLDALVGYHKVTNLSHYWPFREEKPNDPDYRITYRPKSKIDSLAFDIMRIKEKTLAEAHANLADSYFAQKNYAKAFEEYRALIYMAPFLHNYYINTAECLIQLSDLSQALEYLNNSIQLEPTFEAYFRAGEIYFIEMNLEKAATYFDLALSIAPEEKRVNVLAKRFILYAYMGQNGKAKETFEELKQLYPNASSQIPPMKFSYMAYIPYTIRNQVEEAQKQLKDGNPEKALEVLLPTTQWSKSPVADRILGDIYSKLQNHSEALFYYTKSGKHFTTDPMFLHKLGVCLLLNNRKSDAEKTLTNMKKYTPQHPAIKSLEEIIDNYR